MPSDKFTEEVAERILLAVKTGASNEVAAAYGGIGGTTLETWIARGEGRSELAPQKRYTDFAKQYRLAKVQTRVQMSGRVLEASKRDWRAATWWLERNRDTRDDWGKYQKIEIAIDNKLLVMFTKAYNQLPPDIYRQVLECFKEDMSESVLNALPMGAELEGEFDVETLTYEELKQIASS